MGPIAKTVLRFSVFGGCLGLRVKDVSARIIIVGPNQLPSPALSIANHAAPIGAPIALGVFQNEVAGRDKFAALQGLAEVGFESRVQTARQYRFCEDVVFF